MRIVHVTTHFQPFIGGLENMVLQLAQAQSEKHEVIILTLKYKPSLLDFEAKNKIKIYRFPSYEYLDNQYSSPKFGFSKKIKSLKPDIVFTHTRFFATSFLALLGRKKYPKNKRPLFIHVEHGQNFVRAKNRAIRYIAWAFDQTLGRYIFRKSDKIVVLGEKGGNFVQKFLPKNKIKKIKIIPNGQKIPEKISPMPQKNKALFFGRIIREKGIFELLKAAKKCPHWTFEIVGKIERNFVKIIKESPDNIIFSDIIPPEKINEKIQSADLIILPSWSEGNSLAILEAAANKRAILATDVGQNKAIVASNFLVPIRSPEKIIEKLNFLEDNFKILGQAGTQNYKKVKEKYSFETMTKAYEDLI